MIFEVNTVVSILTRPRGRVLLLTEHPKTHVRRVSILTRPRGRVLLVEEVAGRLNLKFQSSPAHVGGCYPQGYCLSVTRQDVSILTRPRGRVLHIDLGVFVFCPLFQSSPAHVGGCYDE